MRNAIGTTFTVTDDHLKLLRRASVGWSDCEFGAPEIDPKRPYGNSNVLGDIAEILGLGEANEALTRDAIGHLQVCSRPMVVESALCLRCMKARTP